MWIRDTSLRLAVAIILGRLHQAYNIGIFLGFSPMYIPKTLCFCACYVDEKFVPRWIKNTSLKRVMGVCQCFLGQYGKSTKADVKPQVIRGKQLEEG